MPLYDMFGRDISSNAAGTPPDVLFTGKSSRLVNNNPATVSAVPLVGAGSMTIPANYVKAGKTLILKLEGSYMTPAVPGGVLVAVKFGSTVLASVNVAASILAANSTNKYLGGEVVIDFYGAGAAAAVTCTGTMEFEIATGSTKQTFSTFATTGAETINVDTTVPQLLDVVQTWTNAQNPQGTRILTACLVAYN